MNTDSKLVYLDQIDLSKIVFTDCKIQSIPGTKFSYKFISIRYKENNKSYPLIISTVSNLFSFGISRYEQTDKYNMNICLFTRNGATSEEQSWFNTFLKIIDKCKDYILSNKKDLNLKITDKIELNSMDNIIKYTTDGKQPILRVKLPIKNQLIIPKFYDIDKISESDLNDAIINPNLLENNHCIIQQAAIIIDSIYVGPGGPGKIYLQIKLGEAHVEILNQHKKKLLPIPPSKEKIIESDENEDDNDDEDEEIIKDTNN